MRMLVHKRMDSQLIADDALDTAITYSGGVFRELARLMRASISRARIRKSAQVQLPDV